MRIGLSALAAMSASFIALTQTAPAQEVRQNVPERVVDTSLLGLRYSLPVRNNRLLPLPSAPQTKNPPVVAYELSKNAEVTSNLTSISLKVKLHQ